MRHTVVSLVQSAAVPFQLKLMTVTGDEVIIIHKEEVGH
jgi:hypothetical protein